jgi:hypothetical protein
VATQKKATAPDFYFVQFSEEVVDLVSGGSEDVIFFQRLFQQFMPNSELLDVNEFCEAEQEIFEEPDVSDWFNGLNMVKYRRAILQKLFHEFAEEV